MVDDKRPTRRDQFRVVVGDNRTIVLSDPAFNKNGSFRSRLSTASPRRVEIARSSADPIGKIARQLT
jgi:hypothetical protein